MESLKVLQLSGEHATFDEATVEKLRSALRGGLLLPNDEGFDKARTVWNALRWWCVAPAWPTSARP
jgi:hypothetical protein